MFTLAGVSSYTIIAKAGTREGDFVMITEAAPDCAVCNILTKLPWGIWTMQHQFLSKDGPQGSFKSEGERVRYCA